MGDSAFLLSVAFLLGGATFLLRSGSRSGLGFAMCGGLYPLFAAGFFLASETIVIATWLALAVLNLALQYRALPSQRPSGVALAVALASLFLWPIQFAALEIHESDEAAVGRSRMRQRERIGTLPATVTGTVSFTYHIGSETGEDMVWLEEYEDLEFFITSELYDAIGIEEGRRVSISIEERQRAEANQDETALWITDGTVLAG